MEKSGSGTVGWHALKLRFQPIFKNQIWVEFGPGGVARRGVFDGLAWDQADVLHAGDFDMVRGSFAAESGEDSVERRVFEIGEVHGDLNYVAAWEGDADGFEFGESAG